MEVSYSFDGLTVGVEHLWPVAALPVAVALLAYLIFRGEAGARSASTRSRRLLFASRVLVVALLVVGAMGPYTVQTRETPGEPRVTLLSDESASMGVFPNATDGLVDGIESAGVPVTTATIASGSDSRIGDGIAANLRENGTVVVVSDGQVTGGRSLAAAAEDAQRLNATVSAVELSPERTERAVSVDGPSTASVGLSTEFVVSLSGVEADDAASVTVEIDGETVREESLAGGESISVEHTFESVGDHRVTATVQGEDVYQRNDVYYHDVRVVEKPNLLYVSGGDYRLQSYLGSLYNVTNATAVPPDLDDYAAVVVQDTPASQLGNVSALQEHVIDGGGLVTVGGDNAFQQGDYGESAIASMLPVRMGNATGGRTNIVLLVDISGSAEEGLAIQKGIALDVLDQLGDRNQVGVVAFGGQAYRIADRQQLGDAREAIAERIRRLETTRGGTDIANGLLGARDMLGNNPGTVILLSDGVDDPDRPAAVANQLGREGVRVITVGAGERVNAGNLRRIAQESGGSYFGANETSRLRLLFGGSSRQYRGQNLTIVKQNTFITSGVTLTANPSKANEVSVKAGADYQVATADGTPAIASWRFGLGRVVSITAYGEDGGLDGLLDQPDSLVVTKSVNYAIGDPGRNREGVTDVSDARVGSPATLTYRGDERPSVENVSFRQISEGTYRGEFTPRETGYRSVLDATYAVNYPLEYARLGVEPRLERLVDATGGREFGPDEGAEIARLAKEQSTRVRTVRDAWGWLALLGAFVVFSTEVILRRVQVYRGRTSLTSGLP
ncbi:VWA domain-containing protein [Halosimplex aquaticum]|uniref:VWA domain-containing protein n=1 Tax=Halosimplex aquaticum TaxID=3026162 RepID=A0ABD5XWP0_9EURY|nr:VWA domain-containing protein [Halosimplex aquaticum]